jgi:hypothetical protein
MYKLMAVLALLFAIAMPSVCEEAQETVLDSHHARELKACGQREKEVKYVANTDKNGHPTATPTFDTGLIYVIRSTMLGNKVQTKLAVNGEWKGVNRGNNYFFFALQPGEHYFCSQAENRSILVLNVEAGKTYYLGQRIHFGAWKARTDLIAMEDAEGAEELVKAHPSTWQIR